MHVIFICVEAMLISAPYAFPSLPPLLGEAMFWAGIAGLIVSTAWLLRDRARNWLSFGGPEFIPIIQYRDLARDKFGWRTTGQNDLEVIDLIQSLRQAGAEGSVRFRGRRIRYRDSELVSREPLIDIPKEHWIDYALDWGPFITSTIEENKSVATMNPNQPSHNVRDGGYADIHINRRAGEYWLRSGALAFKGQTEREEKVRRHR